jgi:hypothetical protein
LIRHGGSAPSGLACDQGFVMAHEPGVFGEYDVSPVGDVEAMLLGETK